jgi:hypothetical protein
MESQRHGDHHPVLLHGESTDVLGLSTQSACDCTKQIIVSKCEPSPAQTLLSSTQRLSSSECLYSRGLAQIPPPITPLVNHHPSCPSNSSSSDTRRSLHQTAPVHPPYLIQLREHLRHQPQLLHRFLSDVLKDRDRVSGAPMLRFETWMHRPKRAAGGGPARGGSLRRRGQCRGQDRRE